MNHAVLIVVVNFIIVEENMSLFWISFALFVMVYFILGMGVVKLHTKSSRDYSFDDMVMCCFFWPIALIFNAFS